MIPFHDAPRKAQGIRTKRHKSNWYIFIERSVKEQRGKFACWTIVSLYYFAPEQSTDNAHEIFDLRAFNAGDSEGVKHLCHSPPESERESSTGEAVHGGGKSCSDNGVPGIVVRRGRRYTQVP